MVVVDWILDLWLSALDVGISLRTFVDDWGLLFQDASIFDRAWTAIEAFTDQMDLALDLGKTRLWSTEATARKQFREGHIPVTLSARNLGAHHNFSRHCHNAELQKRLARLPPVWVRLRASHGPYRYKVAAIHMMAWPRALHGISVVHLGACHYKVLRAGALRGLKADRKGPIRSCTWPPPLWNLTRKLGLRFKPFVMPVTKAVLLVLRLCWGCFLRLLMSLPMVPLLCFCPGFEGWDGRLVDRACSRSFWDLQSLLS